MEVFIISNVHSNPEQVKYKNGTNTTNSMAHRLQRPAIYSRMLGKYVDREPNGQLQESAKREPQHKYFSYSRHL